MRAFIDRLGLERCAMVAHDTGATLTRLLALDDHERAGRLVIMNTDMPGHRPPWILLYRLYQRPAPLPMTAAAFG